MELSKDLVKQFAGLMNTPESKKDTPYLFGTAIVNESGINVKIDGSQYITPASSTIGVKNNDRVAILLKNHKAIIMGNATSPAYSGAQTDDKFATTEQLESVSGVSSDVIDAIKEIQKETDKYNKMYQMVSKWSATGAVAPDVKINGGLLEAYTVISKHIAIGDFTNMVVLQTSDFTISNDIGQRYRRVTGAYGAIELASSKEVEFEVGDSYLFTFKCYSVIGTVNCIIRYYYSDGTWSDAGLTTLTFTTNKLDKFDVIVKIKSLPTNNKTLTQVRYFIETTKDTNNVFDLYQEDLALRKMYAGKLIVDGSITAKSIDAEQFFTGKVGDKANSLFASLGAFEETKNLLDTTNALANLNSSSLGELNVELEANITNTNNALKSIDDLNKSFDSFKSEGNKYSVMYKMISKWANGAVKEETRIDGGLIATDTILAKHIAIGDFTNMVNYQASDFDLVDQDGNPMRRKSDSSYARMVLTTTKRIEFEVGDSYLFTFFAKMSYSKANCFIRYIYTDGTWENAGSTTFDVNVNKVEKHNVKVVIKTPLNTNKTLSYTQFLIEVSSTSECTLDLYMKDLALRKMYGGNLIGDGTISARHLNVDELFARKLHSHNGSIMFTDDVSWNDRMTSTTTINGTNIILRPNINNKNGRPCRFRLGYLFNSDSSLSNLELRMGTQDVIDVGNLYTEQIHLRHCSGINSNGYPEYDHTRQIWLGGDGRIHCDAAIMTQDAIIMDNNKALYCKEPSGSWVHAISVGEDSSARVFTWYTGGNLKVGNANTPETHVSGKKVYLKGQGYVNNSLISTSDANLKNTPTSFDERYYRLAEMLNFKLFRFNDGTSGRFHSGLFAQEVEECMAECGISMEEYAIVCIDQTEDENGNNQVIHSLRYDEINNLMNWYTRERIRRQDARLQALEEQNMMLMNEISELKS